MLIPILHLRHPLPVSENKKSVVEHCYFAETHMEFYAIVDTNTYPLMLSK